MFGLGKLFGKSGATNTNQKLKYPPAFSINTAQRSIQPEEINQNYYSLLLGVNSPLDNNLNNFEKKSLAELEDTLNNRDRLAGMLPRLPLVLPRLMKLLREEKSTAHDIAALIKEDPTLVADVMRLTESPFYKTRNKITSLEHAVVMLGREGVKRLVASAILKPLLNNKNGFFMKMSSALLWDHAEKNSQVAYEITRGEDQTRFHAYLAGLLGNLGFTVGLKILDKTFTSDEAPHNLPFFPKFEKYCRLMSAEIAQAWGMPNPVIDSLKVQAEKCSSNVSELDLGLYIADLITKTSLLRKQLGIHDDPVSFRLDEHISTRLLNSYLKLTEPKA